MIGGFFLLTFFYPSSLLLVAHENGNLHSLLLLLLPLHVVDGLLEVGFCNLPGLLPPVLLLQLAGLLLLPTHRAVFDLERGRKRKRRKKFRFVCS